MKTFLRTLSLCGLLLASAPLAFADYQTCMQHCMAQHDFDYCQATCLVPFEPKSAGICLLTDEEQMGLIEDFVETNYSHTPSISYASDDQNLFEVEWFPTDEECRGVVKLNADCQVERHEKFSCEYTGWTQEQVQQEKEADRKRKEIYEASVAAIQRHYPFAEEEEIRAVYYLLLDDYPENEFKIWHWPDGNTSCSINVVVTVDEYHVQEERRYGNCP